MERYVRLPLVFTLLLISLMWALPTIPLSAQSPPLRVMSFNIRYPNPEDGFNYWPHRKELVASMIRYHDADLIGVQEAHRSQLDELTDLLPGYRWYGVCRTDGSTDPNPDGEFSAILYREERILQVEGGTFWLSQTPEQVGSVGWDAALPRIVTWCKFQDKSDEQEFFHFNTHFDHMGKQARAESARLILRQITAIAGEQPVLLTGDFNATPTELPYRILIDEQEDGHVQDALSLTQLPHHGPLATWTNAFQFPGIPGRRIDYIFVKNGIAVRQHAILSESWSGRLPSDHLPVLAAVIIASE